MPLLAFALIIGSMFAFSGCQLPALNEEPPPLPALEIQPPVSVGPLPPALVETVPLAGSELPLRKAITFYFNQPMDRETVEAALSGTPALNGVFTWVDDTTLTYSPAQPYEPNSTFSVMIGTAAQSQDGLGFEEPVTLQFKTADYLRLNQMLPNQGTQEVAPESAIVVTFNEPVVALGADADLPDAFTLEPEAQGRGEWLNTSTYIFYPEPALFGGTIYTVRLEPTLQSTSGTGLESSSMWNFYTLEPGYTSYSPQKDALHVGLDEPVEVVFNQAMDTDSVEAGFSLVDENQQPVPGVFSWSDDSKTMTYTPDELYRRGVRYTFSIPSGVLSSGGAVLPAALSRDFYAAMEFFVLSTTPVSGGQLNQYAPVEIEFNAPIGVDNLTDYISVEPEVKLSANNDSGSSLFLYGNFEAEETYTLTVSGGLADIWGDDLEFDFSFTFTGAPLEASFLPSTYQGFGLVYANPNQPVVSAQVVNVDAAIVDNALISFSDYLNLQHTVAYEERQGYTPDNISQFTSAFDIQRNRSQVVPIYLNGGQPLSPGLYWVRLSPQPAPQYSTPTATFVVASHVQMVYKAGASDALVWAIDRRTQSPVSGQQVVIYDTAGAVLGSGMTDETGLFKGEIAPTTTPSTSTYAVLANPGEQFFSVAYSDWNQGISPWDYSLVSDFSKPQTEYYLYTDRPIYQPGDAVDFRVVAREAQNGRYSLPEDELATISIFDYTGAEIDTITMPYGEFGTVEGSFSLPNFAEPGYYELVAQDEDYDRSIGFQVAEYRKPEIDLELAFGKQDYLAGDQLGVSVSSRYFFDAPASDVDLTWNVYAAETTFSLPGYHVGPAQDFRYSRYLPGGSLLGNWQSGGEGVSGDDGSFSVTTPSAISDQTQRYTLEVVMQDDSGLPVANRTSVLVHPAFYYIGIKPDRWIGQIDSEMNFELLLVDWDKNPAGEQAIDVSFGKVTWESSGKDQFGFPSYERKVDVLGEASFMTSTNGEALLPFTPGEPGVYQLEVRAGTAVSQLMFWVGGPGTAQWPNRDESQITILSSAENFAPGEVGSVFIPNPFENSALALITTERGEIMSSQITQISESGMNFPVQFTEGDAPNVYLTATLIGQEADGRVGFHYGVVDLPVDAGAYELNVEVLGQPARTGPGEPVSFTIQVTDHNSAPVQAEFSLSVVDQALLALADPVEQDIFSAFYSDQPLGVRTGISLAADAEAYLELPPGIGGGGGGDQGLQAVRSDFQDTAYWNGTVVTGVDGTAVVEASLPDNLTTWQVLARGVTTDTRVGEAFSEVVTTKPLILRPVMPRFAVAGDHLEAVVVVQNNTDQAVEVDLMLTASGFVLDDASASTRNVEVPAQSRVRTGWWGTVEQAESIEVVFSGQGGGYADSTLPAQGSIPVVGYAAPQAFVTAGVMDDGGEQLELVSLPRSFEPGAGKLRLEMSPSLAGVALDVQTLLDEDDFESSEYLVTSYLPQLQMYLALQEFGLATEEFENSLNAKLRANVHKLEASQNFDGGWSWYATVGAESSPQISAYVLLGLLRAEQAGYPIRTYVKDYAVQYLTEYVAANQPTAQQPWDYDQAAFIHYVLSQAGSPLVDLIYTLADEREQLNPWGQALLGLALLQVGESEQSNTLFNDLQTSAVRSSTGVHWEETGRYWQNLSSDSINQAIVLYALAQLDPASPLVADGVRYLMSERDADGGWHSTYATSWALMAVTEVMRGTGELGGDFAFSATLNDSPFAEGQAGGAQQFNQVVAETGLASLLPDLPNALNVQRDPGSGRLYYRAVLDVVQPVETISARNRGVGVSRLYYDHAVDCRTEDCQPVQSAQVGDLLTVRLTLNLASDTSYLAVKDYIPAGTEILNLNLQTSQLGEAEQTQNYLPEDPFSNGWGWWYFGSPQVYDDHIAWMGEYLPAGTYELTYTLVVLQPGSFRVIPAQAQQIYFPEVQGISEGTVFEISE